MAPRIWRSAVLVALALAVTGGAGGKKSLEDTASEKPETLEGLVDEVVLDSDRNAQAKELLGELDRTIQIYFEEVRETQLATLQTGFDYDASAESLTAVQDRLTAAREARRGDIIALAMKARQVMTAEEWTELSKRRLTLLGEIEGGTR